MRRHKNRPKPPAISEPRSSLKFFETEEFRLTQKHWYARIRSLGFEDEEIEKKEGSCLKYSSSYPFIHNRISREELETRLDYFLAIEHAFNEEKFEGKKGMRDRMVMELRSRGVRNKDILEALFSHGFICHRLTIKYIIRRYENKWGIREWEEQAMTSNRLIKS